MIVVVSGRRCWVLQRRLHHGLAGAFLALAGLTVPSPVVGPVLFAVGAALMFHDRRDLPWTPTRAAV